MPIILLLPCLLTLLSGCSFVNLQSDLEQQSKLITITGQIRATPETTGPIKVVLIRGNNQQPTIIRTNNQKHPDQYLFISKPDRYQVFAFEDSNRDGKYTAPERAGRSIVLEASEPGSRHKADIVIPRRPTQEILKEIRYLKENGIYKHQQSSLQIDTIISLDNEIFSSKNATRGLWQPYGFALDTPIGFFLLDEYDPSKKVVLFIHGVSGSPRQFKAIIENLDHNKLQPLVAYYPTGFSIGLISQYMNHLIHEFQVTYGNDAIAVVAHSMGGLVGREFINIQARHNAPITDCFITISTPWNGHAAANSGLKYAPVVIPVWRDMTPKSNFMKTLFSTPLPATTPHYLLFGFKGQSRTTSGNSDGAVSIASQLRPEAQQEANVIRGFNEGHVSILSNPQVTELVNQILINSMD